ncbi:MAG: MMPL family transporter [Candidatus Hadarchaeales archaeon]
MARRFRLEEHSFLLVIGAVLVYMVLCAIFNPGIPASSYFPPALVLVLTAILFLNAKRVSEAVKRHPAVVLSCILAVTACLAPGLSKLTLNVELRSFLPPSYESARTTLEVENMLGGISSEIILIESENLWNPSCVKAVHEMKLDLKRQLAGYLLEETYNYLRGIENRLGENFPENLEELSTRLEELRSDPSVVAEFEANTRENRETGLMVGRLVYRVAKLPSAEEIRNAKILENVVKSHAAAAGFRAYVGGDHSASKDLMRTIEEERVWLFGIAGVLVLICLLLTYRKFKYIMLSLLSIGLAILWVLCLMGWFGIEFSPVVVGVFPLLLGLGIDYSIYVNYRYSEERQAGQERGDAAALVIRTVGVAVFLSCMTTQFGYGSWLSSPMRPLFDFGALSMMGIGFSYFMAILFLPSCRILLDRGVEKGELVDRFSVRAVEKGLTNVGTLVERRSKPILAIAAVVTLLAIASATRARTAIEWEKMLPSHVESLETSARYLELFPGENPMSAIIVLVEGNVASSETLSSIEKIESFSKQSRFISGSPLSLPGMVRSRCGGLIPQDENTIREVLGELLQQEPRLESVVSSDYRRAVILLMTENMYGDNDMKAAVDHVRKGIQQFGRGADYRVGGLPAVYGDLLTELPSSQLKTTLIAFVGCFLILLAVFRRIGDATLCMIPIGLTLVWGLGMFPLIDLPINLLTVLVSAMLIGIGIDYSIHVRHRFVEELAKGRSIEEATKETMTRIGGAVLGAASTSLAAMGTLMFSRMPAVGAFGEIVGLEFAACLCAVFFVLPAALAWWAKKGAYRHLMESGNSK